MLLQQGWVNVTFPGGRPDQQPLGLLLEQHVPADAKEEADLQLMRERLGVLQAPFSRSQPDAHFTGSALVVDGKGERVCLIHHRKLARWLQPGGHAESSDGGRIDLTALREAREELGVAVRLHPQAPRPLDVDAHVIPAKGDEASHLHLDIRFLVELVDETDALSPQEEEVTDCRWFSWTEALAVADEEPLRRLLRKGLALLARAR
jgi:8-oxo-dGTP pyrophosphatase MutT (NUDIX family)